MCFPLDFFLSASYWWCSCLMSPGVTSNHRFFPTISLGTNPVGEYSLANLFFYPAPFSCAQDVVLSDPDAFPSWSSGF